ncbi:MAG: hypothetical protein M1827_007049 [Pycnora praestabilis]|nr:MAG: hypothetical protein M1827_007049 [Pycnora praestabilis]
MDYFLLPATTYTPPPHGQVPNRRCGSSNEIGHQGEVNFPSALQPSERKQIVKPSLRIQSPMSDDFPTPRAVDRREAASPLSANSSASSEWSVRSHGLDFDELYDISEDEAEPERKPSVRISHSSIISNSTQRSSTSSVGTKSRYPSLVIPSPGLWPNICNAQKFQKNSPIPPTPPPKIPLSPAVLSLLAKNVPASSALPSLDGSLTSDQMTRMSAPSTPNTQRSAADPEEWSTGVQLHPHAMATLQSLSGKSAGDLAFDEQVMEVQRLTEQEMSELTRNDTRSNSAEVYSPATQQSLASLAQLDIPSPGGFFASLGAGARNTWCPASAVPPSSTTAEHFYRAPWNVPTDRTIDRVIEVDETTDAGPPTARQEVISPQPTVEEVDEIKTTELVIDYDEEYERELEQLASANIDRTSTWLAAQTSYLSALRETNPVNLLEDDLEKTEISIEDDGQQSIVSPSKKSVRFLAADLTSPSKALEDNSEAQTSNSTYYHAFQHLANHSRPSDTFVHRRARHEALQASRVCASEAHRNQLIGKLQPTSKARPSPLRPISEMFDSSKSEALIADPASPRTVIARAEREREALEQISLSAWSTSASKFLNGGKLLSSPAAKRLAWARPQQAKVLDLGGLPACDWAWQCAREYPNTKVYTAINKRQSVNTALRGPQNHRQVVVPSLWQLPFDSNTFDIISARSLYTLLKTDKPADQVADEYDLCLQECLRCLKPGGYLEFSVLDSDIIHAGPAGSAMSVEFGFNLKTRGYDPTPSRQWIGRLKKAGFGNVRRAWMFLPMGAPKAIIPSKRDAFDREKIDSEADKENMGSTRDAASITGLVGSWAWEKWMLKLQMEMGKDEERLLEGVGAVLEEGKGSGAGWRSLTGWARKPLRL